MMEPGSSAKVAVITGCTRGIGRALFAWFADHGLAVAGCGTSAAELQALCLAYPGAMVSTVDVRNEQEVIDWTKEIAERLGPIDILVCNAGVSHSPAKFCEIAAEVWQRSLEVNALATARVLRHAVPCTRSPGATIVLMSSRYGRTAACGQSCYSASKWPIEAMAKTLALELRDQGVATVSLDPGVVNTDMLRMTATGPEDLEWCQQQQSPSEFAAKAGPFILSLTLEDTGRSLTCPGSPGSYFQTGVVYKDRPAWANGIGPFVRAADDHPRLSVAGVAGTVGSSARRYFISGVMLGSRKELTDASTDLLSQDYRSQIAAAILAADPTGIVVDPLPVAHERAAEKGRTLADLDDDMVRDIFAEVVDLAAQCDVIVSNLPEASMGSAVELWEAKKAGRVVFTISPMTANWTLRSVTDHNFADIEDFEANFVSFLPSSEPKAVL